MMRLASSLPGSCSQQHALPFTVLPYNASPKPVQGRLKQHLIANGVKGQSYNVEIECDEDEDPEGVFKRFRNSCNQAGMVYEARKRKHFENRQDIKKRKQQEKGMHKARAMRERYLTTYGDAHSDTPPFSDLFQGQEDIYDIIGSMSDSYDDDRSMFSRRQARNNSNSDGAASNSLSSSANIEASTSISKNFIRDVQMRFQDTAGYSDLDITQLPETLPSAESEGKEANESEPEPMPASDPNIITRSVPSDGPQKIDNNVEPQAKSRQRPKFETAKSRKAQAAARA